MPFFIMRVTARAVAIADQDGFTDRAEAEAIATRRYPDQAALVIEGASVADALCQIAQLGGQPGYRSGTIGGRLRAGPQPEPRPVPPWRPSREPDDDRPTREPPHPPAR